MLKQSHLRVNSDLNDLGILLNWLNSIGHITLPEMEWLRCQIAVAEGFTNAVRHAHRDLPPETPIDVEVKIAPEYIELYVWDYGPFFDLQQQLLKMPLEDREADRGRGLIIMNQVADRLTYERLNDSRNYLLMVKDVSVES